MFVDPDRLGSTRTGASPIIAADERPLLVDEWQRVHPTWDFVRRLVDKDHRGGQFLLTGSAPMAESHSGAGRITSMRMRPLTLPERGVEVPTVSLAALLAGNKTVGGRTKVALRDYVDEMVAGGFPAMRSLERRALARQLDSYIERIVTHDLSLAGLVARHSATVLAWSPANNHQGVLSQSPRHYLADPALAARLVRRSATRLLGGDAPESVQPRDGGFLGGLFENLAGLSVRLFAQANDAQVHHLRTEAGRREVDFIVETDDGVLGIEVKLAATVHDGHVRHLVWLKDRLGTECIDTIVLHSGPEAYRRPDGVAVVPLALCGP